MRGDPEGCCDEAQNEMVATLDAALGNFIQLAVRARTHVATATSSLIGLPLSGAALMLLDALSTRPMRLTELAGFVGIRPSSLTRQIQELEAKGLVDRSTDEQDGRAAIIELTHSGREVLAAAAEIKQSFLGEVIRGWSAEQVQEVVEMLDQLGEGVFAGWKGFSSSHPAQQRARLERMPSPRHGGTRP